MNYTDFNWDYLNDSVLPAALSSSLPLQEAEDYSYDYDLEESVNTFYWLELGPTILVYGITFLIGLVGNSLIIFTITFYRRMKSTTNLFLASLASADLLLIVCCIPVKRTYKLEEIEIKLDGKSSGQNLNLKTDGNNVVGETPPVWLLSQGQGQTAREIGSLIPNEQRVRIRSEAPGIFHMEDKVQATNSYPPSDNCLKDVEFVPPSLKIFLEDVTFKKNKRVEERKKAEIENEASKIEDETNPLDAGEFKES